MKLHKYIVQRKDKIKVCNLNDVCLKLNTKIVRKEPKPLYTISIKKFIRVKLVAFSYCIFG